MKPATAYLDQYGIPWRRPVPGDFRPTWDGEVLTLEWHEKGDTKPNNLGWVFHEISHYLFAPPASRKLPNYGLGMDPGGGAYSERVRGSERGQDPQEDEGAVCILDIILMLEAGLPETVIRFHTNEYNIDVLRQRDLELLAEVGFPPERVEKARPYLAQDPLFQ